ncbi:ABC transporter substrate-binding protein [Mangrovactinospora gilvigrisea]|uniref:ABC transporter substrate-binding protein n=1 Tax=Mangrovactinospora gilvigrisea TaxID=1428644 RepID=A0A1J7BG92_9ACTN|nr:zinc ABC transporter substrate-binding protein [Mangrovactinospora gilvigrisea]OIV37662.1 ABC transporter substrate-binding protein [Mangrovactinospora gilvigrisea]
MLNSSSRLAAAVCGAAALAVALSACGGGSSGSRSATAGGKVDVVAATDVWGDVAKQVGGDRADVTSIISDPNQDPHGYEANTRTQLAISKAAVVIENGGGYDDFMARMVKTAGGRAKVVNAVQVSGKKPVGGDLNEHVWYDFGTAEKVAGAVADRLAEADPAGAAEYRRNAAAFTAKLKPLQQREARLKKEYAGRGIAVTEPVPLYMTQAIGLVDRTPEAFSHAVEEGDDVPVGALRQTLGLFAGSGKVSALLYNAQAADAAAGEAEHAAKAGGVAVIPVTETLPAGQDYQSWMSANLDHISAALKG